MSTIVIVDPSESYLNELKDQLRNCDFEVLTAECVLSALETARAQNAELILFLDRCDDLDVLDLLELKSKIPTLTPTAVVVLSTSTEKKLECYRRGCDDFIQLPVDTSELLFRICAVLKRELGSGLSGALSEVNFLDLVQMLSAGRKTGGLLIKTDTVRGQLFFNKGQVFHANTTSDLGEEAFFSLLKATQSGGAFDFVASVSETVKTNITKRTEHLLLELANRLDENS